MLWAGVDGSGAVCVYGLSEAKLDDLTPDEARVFAHNLLHLADVVEDLNDAPDSHRARDQADAA